MKITAHILVKNEEKFIWYSVMSIIRYVDRVRIWDTGSTDGTVEIIKEIANTKEAKEKEIFEFRQLNEGFFDEDKMRQKMLETEKDLVMRGQNSEAAPNVGQGFWYARQKMLEKTTADWFLIVDADEVWWNDSIKKVTDLIRAKGSDLESVVVPTMNLVGDLFHYQEKLAGRYHLARRVGHYNLRAINRKIPGLFSFGRHGISGWMDRQGNLIQNRDPKKVFYLDAPYLHATHLQRSSGRRLDKLVFKRSKKLKYEIGYPIPGDFYYPEVFFRPRPNIVSSPWETIGSLYKFRAFFETPLRRIYRRSLLKYKKHGY